MPLGTCITQHKHTAVPLLEAMPAEPVLAQVYSLC